MTQELQSLLSEYLGELLHYEENEHDWIMKSKIEKKVNAVRTLLDIPVDKETRMERVFRIVKENY
jgi:hypothetical protein